eukprot:1478686-Amphidinium_carterae.2
MGNASRHAVEAHSRQPDRRTLLIRLDDQGGRERRLVLYRHDVVLTDFQAKTSFATYAPGADMVEGS